MGKGKTTDNGTHAPLVVSWKGHTKQGVIDSSLIDLVIFCLRYVIFQVLSFKIFRC